MQLTAALLAGATATATHVAEPFAAPACLLAPKDPRQQLTRPGTFEPRRHLIAFGIVMAMFVLVFALVYTRRFGDSM